MPYLWIDDDDDTDVPVGVYQGTFTPRSHNKYIMYHGTAWWNVDSIWAKGFRWSADGMVGSGVYLSRFLEKSKYYPINCHESDRVVFKVVVNVGNLITIKNRGHPRRKNWHDSRYGPVYDTAWVPPRSQMVRSNLEVLCVWDPRQIEIIRTIYPQPVQPYCGARGYM